MDRKIYIFGRWDSDKGNVKKLIFWLEIRSSEMVLMGHNIVVIF